jgi:hypothetical protein
MKKYQINFLMYFYSFNILMLKIKNYFNIIQNEKHF